MSKISSKLAVGNSTPFSVNNTFSSNQWNDIFFGNGVWIACKSNIIAYSTDGISWTETTISGLSGSLAYISYGSGKFIVMSNYYWTAEVVYSTTGTSGWTLSVDNAFTSYKGPIASSGSIFVAVNNGNTVWYSSDGLSWVLASIPVSKQWTGIAYGNGLFVCSTINDNTIIYSNDGINYTDGNTGVVGGTAGLSYQNNKFIAFSGIRSYYSTDGVNWTSQALANPYNPSISYFGHQINRTFYNPTNGYFAFTGGSGSSSASAAILKSSDGITWTDPGLSTYPSASAVSYSVSDDLFIVTSYDNSYTTKSSSYILNLPLSWTAPAGVTEVMIQPVDASGNVLGISRTVTVVPNTTYIINITSSNFAANNPNSLGTIFYWTGSSNLKISWVE